MAGLLGGEQKRENAEELSIAEVVKNDESTAASPCKASRCSAGDASTLNSMLPYEKDLAT